MTNDPNDADDPIIPDMARKIEHLKGIMAANVTDDAFSDKKLALICGCTNHTFSRKKTGGAQFKPGELGRLIHTFKLGVGFSYSDFSLDFEAFDKKLRSNQVGTYATDPRSELRRLLTAICDPNETIVIKLIKHRQVGGIGGDPSFSPHPVLLNGQHVQLVVPLPPHAKGGHLLVLNYSPQVNGGISLLMPSRYAPDTEVLPYPLTLPTKDSIEPSFPVSTPEGVRPIFALWSIDPPSTFLTLPEETEATVTNLTPATMTQLCSYLRADAQSPNSHKLLAFKGQYDVQDIGSVKKQLRR